MLTDTANVKDYMAKMRKRDDELSKGWGQFVTPLEITTKGGVQKLNCANTEGIFRVIQSIPYLEQIFSMMSEAATTEIARNKDAKGFHENKKIAHDQGKLSWA